MFGSALDELEESGACLFEAAKELVVAGGNREDIELREGDRGFEALFGVDSRFQFLAGLHHVFEGIAFASLAFRIGGNFAEDAGPTEIHSGVEKVLAEKVDLGGKALRDMDVA